MTAGSTAAVFAVVQLSHLGKPYYPGDRIDGIIPGDVLELCIERGEASRTKPKTSE